MWLKKKPAEAGSDVEEILECIKGEIVGAKDKEDDVLELTELVDDQEAKLEVGESSGSRAAPGIGALEGRTPKGWSTGVFAGARSSMSPIQEDARRQVSGNFGRGDAADQAASTASDKLHLEDLPNVFAEKDGECSEGCQRNQVNKHHGGANEPHPSQNQQPSDNMYNGLSSKGQDEILELSESYGSNACGIVGERGSVEEATAFGDARAFRSSPQQATSIDSKSSAFGVETPLRYSAARDARSSSELSALESGHSTMDKGVLLKPFSPVGSSHAASAYDRASSAEAVGSIGPRDAGEGRGGDLGKDASSLEGGCDLGSDHMPHPTRRSSGSLRGSFIGVKASGSKPGEASVTGVSGARSVAGHASDSDESALGGGGALERDVSGPSHGFASVSRDYATGSARASVTALRGGGDGSSLDASKKVKLGGIGVADDIEHVMHLINSSDFTSVGGSCEYHVDREEIDTGPVNGASAARSVSGACGISASNAGNGRPDALTRDPGLNLLDPWEKLVKDAVESKVCAWLEQNRVLENWMEQNLPAALDKWMKEDSNLQDLVNQHLSVVLRSVVEEKLSKILEKVK